MRELASWTGIVHPVAGGSMLTIFAVPRSGVTKVDRIVNGALRIKVAAPPVDGKANEVLVRFLASIAGVPRGKVDIVAGSAGRQKRIHFDGFSPDDLARALSARAARPDQ